MRSSEIVELTSTEYQRMSDKLSKALDPKYISSRAGPRGVRLFYLEGWRIIEAANDVFGFNGWSHSVVDLKVDYVSINLKKNTIMDLVLTYFKKRLTTR